MFLHSKSRKLHDGKRLGGFGHQISQQGKLLDKTIERWLRLKGTFAEMCSRSSSPQPQEGTKSCDGDIQSSLEYVCKMTPSSSKQLWKVLEPIMR